MTNTGAEMPMVANTMQNQSMPLPRCSAAAMPRGMPISSDTRIATPPTFAEVGKWLKMISLAVVSGFLKEVPKSNLSRPFQ